MKSGGREDGGHLISRSSNGSAAQTGRGVGCWLLHMRSPRTAALVLMLVGSAFGFIPPSALTLRGAFLRVVGVFVG